VHHSREEDSSGATVRIFTTSPICLLTSRCYHSKREHLLGEIKSQAKEIERLMRELEKVTSTSSNKRSTDQVDDAIANFSSPVLSPTSTSGSFFGSEAHPSGTSNADNNENAEANKAIQDWIAKARESLHDFGNFMEIGGAALPKKFLLQDDAEDTSSDEDEEYADASDDFENNTNYGLTIERPEGGETRHYSDGPSGNKLQHKLSGASIATAATASTSTFSRKKKDSADKTRSANLPVEASPFGLFSDLSLRNPASRGTSVEPEEADRGPGIANENFFKPSQFLVFFLTKLTNLFSRPCTSSVKSQIRKCPATASYSYTRHHFPCRGGEAFQDVSTYFTPILFLIIK